MAAYPSGATARDRFIVDRRPPRPRHDPWRSQGLVFEDERTRAGSMTRSATLFLTGRECPWRCVMCDLWQYTIDADTPAGAIAGQVNAARAAIAEAGVTQLKLYNAGSFFDPRAVPVADYDPVAASLAGLERVIVESHPLLVGEPTMRFLDALARHSPSATPPVLEVAMGLETANPEALERINKRMTCDDFARAAARLISMGVDLRVFLLVSPPFVAEEEEPEWLLRSVDFAVTCGASVISLIATRPGNGALDDLVADGHWRPPTVAGLERALSLAMNSARVRATGTRVFADVWDLDRLSDCDHCLETRRARLLAINGAQQDLTSVSCDHCRLPTSPTAPTA